MHPLHRYERPTHTSYSPVRRTYVENDNHTLKEQYNSRRDVSHDNMQNRNHCFNTNDTPYLNGKKNVGFDNPSYRSSNIFFEHNYGYVNDMPNDRLLTPVKYDRYSRPTTSERGTAMDSRPPLTPTKRREVEDDSRGRTRDVDPRRLQDQYDQNRDAKKERRPSDIVNASANNDQRRRGSGRDQAVSQPPATRPQIREEPNYSFQVRDVPRDSATGPDFHKKKHQDDDAVSQVTIVSNLSNTDYKCPTCLNRCEGHHKESQKRLEKQMDKDLQRLANDMNNRAVAMENERDWNDKQKRMAVARAQKDEIDNKYYDRLEARRSPSREVGDQGFKQIFDKQDEYGYKQRMRGLDYRHDLKDQMLEKEDEKRYQRHLDQRPCSASIQLTEDYYFKKNGENKALVLATLQDQVASKKRRQIEEREDDKIDAIIRTQEARRVQEEEDRRAHEKESRQKREMQNAFWKAQDEKAYKQRDEGMKKAAEKFMVDNQYNEFKRREYDNQVKVRRQYQDFLAGVINQERPSYKKLYEERKQQKQATSLHPTRAQKKVYPCGECSTLYEKKYLTKMV